MRLIRDGIVDLEGVEGLARRLGYSTRQLNRLITAEVGTGPLALARAQRSQTARILLETTDLPIAHIAFAAGFASVRQCNDTIREIFADTPSGLRARAAKSAQAKRDRQQAAPQAIHLRLPCRRPFNPASVLEFLGARALPGVEALEGGVRTGAPCVFPHGHAVVTLAAPLHHRDEQDATDGPAYVGADLVLSDLRDLTTAVARCRQLLTSTPTRLPSARRCGIEPLSGPSSHAILGVGCPGAAEGFELRCASRDRPASLGRRSPAPSRAGWWRPQATRFPTPSGR